jgi:hypothetical protein
MEAEQAADARYVEDLRGAAESLKSSLAKSPAKDPQKRKRKPGANE